MTIYGPHFPLFAVCGGPFYTIEDNDRVICTVPGYPDESPDEHKARAEAVFAKLQRGEEQP